MKKSEQQKFKSPKQKADDYFTKIEQLVGEKNKSALAKWLVDNKTTIHHEIGDYTPVVWLAKQGKIIEALWLVKHFDAKPEQLLLGAAWGNHCSKLFMDNLFLPNLDEKKTIQLVMILMTGAARYQGESGKSPSFYKESILPPHVASCITAIMQQEQLRNDIFKHIMVGSLVKYLSVSYSEAHWWIAKHDLSDKAVFFSPVPPKKSFSQWFSFISSNMNKRLDICNSPVSVAERIIPKIRNVMRHHRLTLTQADAWLTPTLHFGFMMLLEWIRQLKIQYQKILPLEVFLLIHSFVNEVSDTDIKRLFERHCQVVPLTMYRDYLAKINRATTAAKPNTVKQLFPFFKESQQQQEERSMEKEDLLSFTQEHYDRRFENMTLYCGLV